MKKAHRATSRLFRVLAIGTMGASLCAIVHAREPEFTYAAMSDGVQIALAVSYPSGFEAGGAAEKWPALFTMTGYPGEVHPHDPKTFGDRYVVVRASQRGSGASGGALMLFDPRTAQDGYEIIEEWIVRQPWSNGRVGLYGHSWGGINAFQIAATNPPALRAVTASALIDDLYRGIARPGGVPNYGFPFDWLVRNQDSRGAHGSDEEARNVRAPHDPNVEANQKSRPRMNWADDMLWNFMSLEEDGPWWTRNSLISRAADIRAPIIIFQAYQDEQTGPGGFRLWQHVPDDVPKQLILTNGKHRTLESFFEGGRDWLDCWVIGDGSDCGRGLGNREERVWAFFETINREDGRAAAIRSPLKGNTFPFSDTQWTRFYLRADGVLSVAPPGDDAASLTDRPSYHVRNGVADENLERARFTLKFEKPTVICGPISLTLWAKCTTVDTDFYALLLDEDKEGGRQYLQRGLLRASHRDVDEDKSEWAQSESGRVLIRPFHPHTNPMPIEPGVPQKYEIEIFPVGHVVREGHTLVLEIGQPPAGDLVNLDRGGNISYRYASDMPEAQVEIFTDKDFQSSILLPILPSLPDLTSEAPKPGTVAGVHYEPARKSLGVPTISRWPELE